MMLFSPQVVRNNSTLLKMAVKLEGRAMGLFGR